MDIKPCTLTPISSPAPIPPVSDPRPPEKPPGLAHSFLIMDRNITAKLTWQAAVSDRDVISYRLEWGESVQVGEGGLEVTKPETALTKVLGKVRRAAGMQRRDAGV